MGGQIGRHWLAPPVKLGKFGPGIRLAPLDLLVDTQEARFWAMTSTEKSGSKDQQHACALCFVESGGARRCRSSGRVVVPNRTRTRGYGISARVGSNHQKEPAPGHRMSRCDSNDHNSRTIELLSTRRPRVSLPALVLRPVALHSALLRGRGNSQSDVRHRTLLLIDRTACSIYRVFAGPKMLSGGMSIATRQ